MVLIYEANLIRISIKKEHFIEKCSFFIYFVVEMDVMRA